MLRLSYRYLFLLVLLNKSILWAMDSAPNSPSCPVAVKTVQTSTSKKLEFPFLSFIQYCIQDDLCLEPAKKCAGPINQFLTGIDKNLLDTLNKVDVKNLPDKAFLDIQRKLIPLQLKLQNALSEKELFLYAIPGNLLGLFLFHTMLPTIIKQNVHRQFPINEKVSPSFKNVFYGLLPDTVLENIEDLIQSEKTFINLLTFLHYYGTPEVAQHLKTGQDKRMSLLTQVGCTMKNLPFYYTPLINQKPNLSDQDWILYRDFLICNDDIAKECYDAQFINPFKTVDDVLRFAIGQFGRMQKTYETLEPISKDSTFSKQDFLDYLKLNASYIAWYSIENAFNWLQTQQLQNSCQSSILLKSLIKINNEHLEFINKIEHNVNSLNIFNEYELALIKKIFKVTKERHKIFNDYLESLNFKKY